MSKVRQASCLVGWEWGIALDRIQESLASSRIGLGYTEQFHIPLLNQCHSRLVRLFLGTLWSSIKQIKAPFVLYLEHGIAEHEMQENCASSLTEGEISWIFWSCGRILGYTLELWRVGISILVFLQQCQHSCLVLMDTSGI